jgi:hypothetical protein
MRKLKLMSLLLVAVTLIGLASCSKDDNDNQETYYGVVKVEDNMGSIFFETQNGIKYYPTAASLLTVQQNYSFSATSGLAYIICTVTSSDDAAKTKTMKLAAAISLQNTTVATTPGAPNDSTAQQPVVGIDKLNISGLTPYLLLFDSDDLLLATNYNFSTAGHTFTLVFYPSQVNSGDTEMNVYLRHRSTDTGTGYNSYNVAMTYPQLYYRAYDIESIVENFTEKAGNAPTKLTLHTYVNENGLTLPATETTYSVDYK